MPQINDNYRFEELFTIPQGFTHIDNVVLTSYSVDPAFLAIMPHLMYCAEQLNGDYSGMRNVILRKNPYFVSAARRLHLFADGGVKPLPGLRTFLRGGYCAYGLCLQEQCTSWVTLPGRLFHPKLAVVQFGSSDTADKYFRVMISSRNLTAARYFEGGVVLEGRSGGAAENDTGRPIADFLHQCADWSGYRSETVSLPLLAATELHYGTSPTVQVFFGGAGGITLEERMLADFEQARQIRITSPFVQHYLCGSSNSSEGIYRYADRVELVSNPDDFGGEGDKATRAWVRRPAGDPQPLHIKQYLLRRDGDDVVWLGSANFTKPGLTRNVECMVRFAANLDMHLPKLSHSASTFYGGNEVLGYAAPADLACQPQDEEERFALDLTVSGSYSGGVLYIKAENCCKYPVTLLPALLAEGVHAMLGVGCCDSFSFPLRPRQLSSYLVVELDGVTCLAPIHWQDGAPDALPSLEQALQYLPPMVLRTVRDLIPAVRGLARREDEAFERLTKFLCAGRDLLEIRLRIQSVCGEWQQWFDHAAATGEDTLDPDAFAQWYADDCRRHSLDCIDLAEDCYAAMASVWELRSDLKILEKLLAEGVRHE